MARRSNYDGVGTMSKSKNNGVDPQDLIERYGADTARLYTMFTAPPEATLEWNDAAVEGSYRFLRRVWNFGVKLKLLIRGDAACGARPALLRQKASRRCGCEIHTVLKQVDYDYQRMQYNTVVSGGMKMLNALEASRVRRLRPASLAALREGFGILLRCLYPATPHIAHRLWGELGYAASQGDLLDAPWPEGRRRGAGAGRNRTHAADQWQVARLDPVPRHGQQGGDRGCRAGNSEAFVKQAQAPRRKR
jgi:leucyl-tRNA synthetase